MRTNTSPDHRRGALRAGLFAAAYIAGVMIVGAAAAVLLHDLLAGAEGGVAGWLNEQGPGRILRRLLLLLALPGFAFFLRYAGWRGVTDAGWHTETPAGPRPAPWRRDLVLGVVIGLVTICGFVAVSFAAGVRAPDPDHRIGAVLGALAGLAAASLVIGVLEETIARGVLFRVAARLWGAWPAAIGIGVLFAYAHFMKPEAAAFEGGGWLERTGAVMVSTLTGFLRTEDFVWRFINLVLMSVFLSFMVVRTGTIWMAAGTHAAWVWVKRLNGRFADTVDRVDAPAWVASRSDAIDSPLTALVLLLLTLVLVLRRPRAPADRNPTGEG